MSKETLQAQIDLLHEQLEAKELELDAKYAERNHILRKEREVKSSSKIGNIESNFNEDMINDMFNDMSNEMNHD